MRMCRHLVLAATTLLLAAGLAPGHAALGQSAEELTQAFGEPAERSDSPRRLVWNLDDGIIYTVELDAEGKSWIEVVGSEERQDGHKVFGRLRSFFAERVARTEDWKLVDVTTPEAFGGRELKTVHGVVYWRVAPSGEQASALLVGEQPRMGVISPAYAQAHPRAEIFAGY